MHHPSRDDSSSQRESGVKRAPRANSTLNWTDPNLEPAWLPLYFAHWRGSSLVVHDDTISKITPGGVPMPSSTLSADLSGVPILRYGNDYQFRVRLVDLTGGGPAAGQHPVHAGLAPAGFCPFRRYLPPKSLEITATPPAPSLPAPPDAVRAITKLAVQRPRIGYPEAIFAGVSPSAFSATMPSAT